MCPCIEFQSIWRTLDFTQICPKNMNNKNFEKLNMKIEISILQSTSVPNFSRFEELQILGPNFPKNMNKQNFEKVNIKM